MFEVSEIEEKLERIEQNERKLEALYARVDTLERLSSRDISGNSESDVVILFMFHCILYYGTNKNIL